MREELPVGTGDLITPHGDQERGRTRAQEWRGHALITPHGDQELVEGFMFALSTNAHYPPWGSGTRCGAAPGCGVTSHYPPWGSGTVVGLGGEPACEHHSLPPWGSGTRIRVRRVDGLSAGLITPHGDQEHFACGLDIPPLDCAHYPPWGSGTSDSSAALRSSSFSSLPPMGIRNPGDRARRVRCPGAHYPPWGSGTRLTAGWRPGCRRSHYPPWGSGTVADVELWQVLDQAHYPPWGSGTSVEDRRQIRVIDLITPHGDQEPSNSAHFESLATSETTQSTGAAPEFAPGPLFGGSLTSRRNTRLLKNGPVLAVPLIFGLTHWATHLLLAKSLDLYIVAILAHELQHLVLGSDLR